MGLLAFLLPPALVLIGLFLPEVDSARSISGYYHTPLHDIFVGTMAVVSAFLVSYNGYDWRDQSLTTAAGLFGFLLTLFPVEWSKAPWARAGFLPWTTLETNPWHLSFAVLFFVCLAIMSAFLFTQSDEKHPGPGKRLRNGFYIGSAVAMVLALVFCGLSMTVWKPWLGSTPAVLIGEWAALWAFGLSWFIKGETILKDEKK